MFCKRNIYLRWHAFVRFEFGKWEVDCIPISRFLNFCERLFFCYPLMPANGLREQTHFLLSASMWCILLQGLIVKCVSVFHISRNWLTLNLYGALSPWALLPCKCCRFDLDRRYPAGNPVPPIGHTILHFLLNMHYCLLMLPGPSINWLPQFNLSLQACATQFHLGWYKPPLPPLAVPCVRSCCKILFSEDSDSFLHNHSICHDSPGLLSFILCLLVRMLTLWFACVYANTLIWSIFLLASWKCCMVSIGK